MKICNLNPIFTRLKIKISDLNIAILKASILFDEVLEELEK
jgi:hypothetical protein